MEEDAWETSTINRGNRSAKSQGYRSSDLPTAEIAEQSQHVGRPTHGQGVWQSSIASQRDGSPRVPGRRPSDTRPTGMTQSLHLNERSTQGQGTSDFKLESFAKPSQYTRRRRRQRPPKDEGKGEQEPNNDGDPKRLDADGGLQNSVQASTSSRTAPIRDREVVEVRVSDAITKDNNDETRFGDRWTHIQNKGMSLREFKARVMQVPTLDDDDLELVTDLLDQIQRSREHEFVHGRYLDPVTLKYMFEDLESKSVTFVSLPAFSTDYPQMHTTDRDFEGHPVRALMQSRYRLESTDSRDKTQVITHHSNEGKVVIVPQIWALMINNYVVVTCAPVKITELLGETIKTKLYPNALANSSIGSLFFSDIQGNAFGFTDLHFTDPQGKVFCVPLALCRTWFALIKHIVEDCIDDEFYLMKEKIKHELLNGGPSFQLVTKEEFPVTTDSWLQTVKNKTGIIQIRLVDRHGKFKRLLVAQHGEAHESDVASDESSISGDERGDNATEPPANPLSDRASETTVSSTTSSTAEGKSRNLANKLRDLRTKLQEAKAQVDWERVLALSNDIPVLEDRILAWTAENLRSELREKGDMFEEVEGTLPASFGRHWGLRPGSVETSSCTSTVEDRPKSGSGSRSESRSRSTSPFPDSKQVIPTQESFIRASKLLRYNKRPRLIQDYRRNASPARRICYRSTAGRLRSIAIPREHSHTHIVSSRSRVPLQPLSCQQSRWDTVRPRVLSGHYLSSQAPKSSMKSGVLHDQNQDSRGNNVLSAYSEIERPQLASDEPYEGTQNDTSKSQSLGNHDQDRNQDLDGFIGEISCDETLVSQADKLPAVVADWLRLPETARAPLASNTLTDDREIRVGENVTSRKRRKESGLESQHDGNRPTLRRLADLIRKATAMFSPFNVGKKPTGPSALSMAKGTKGLPIFLWPTKPKPSIIAGPPLNVPRVKSAQEEIPKSSSAKLDVQVKEATSIASMEEQSLQMLLAGIHNNLLKPLDPSKLSRELAKFYEGTVGRSPAEVGSLVTPKGRVKSEQTLEDAESATSMKQRAGVIVDGENAGRIMTAVGNCRLPASTPNLVTEHLPITYNLRLKSDVFDLAGKMLHAFVPEGYDTLIVSKYWGAVHKLLRQDVLVESLPVTQIVASSLSKLHERVRDIQEGMRTIDGSPPTLHQVPKSLVAAFQQLLILLVVAGNIAELSSRNYNGSDSVVPKQQLQSMFDECNKCLVRGRMEIIGLMCSDDHDGSSGSLAIDSEALLSLILANFTFHSSESKAFNLTKIYRDYTTKLRSLVRNRAYVRVHHHIPLLVEELDIVKTTLKQQHRTLLRYRENVDVGTNLGISHLSINVLENLLENIKERIRKFDELSIEAQGAHDQSRSLKSESNNKAILVFTVTTIIFLPLSFVTSYLGMNTSDLRDTQSGQTLFWAIGAPVAFLVLGTALLAAFYGEVTHRATRMWWRGKDKFE